MGQTLTHGVYLPDEGERNCYSGLAANWQILDSSVGTIAAHTAALSGKAPLVHTHTKSDITDFPAYGTTAGTICEGNDSRLSDARTPVAHTHTKSDVTDLLNSNFIPSANNSYDLGSSSYQWNNLYAKKVNTQSVNGINPGALSLPNSPGGTGTENVNYYDLSGNITVRDGSAANGFTASCDGWIAIGTFATWLQISNDTLILATTANPGADGFAQAFLPVRKGNAIRIVVNQTNTQFQSFKLLPCEGNV